MSVFISARPLEPIKYVSWLGDKAIYFAAEGKHATIFQLVSPPCYQHFDSLSLGLSNVNFNELTLSVEVIQM